MQVDSNFVMKIYTEKQKDGIKQQRLSDLWICDTIVKCACPQSHFTSCFCHFQLETRVDFVGRWDFPLVHSCLHISNIMSLNL